MVENISRYPTRRIRQGAPGAGWFLVIVYVFSALVFTAWLEGWGENRGRTAAPPTSHRATTTGVDGAQ
jgi:hypothetical protein